LVLATTSIGAAALDESGPAAVEDGAGDEVELHPAAIAAVAAAAAIARAGNRPQGRLLTALPFELLGETGTIPD
jgi:hypothetical protein